MNAAIATTKVPIALGDRSYDIHIGCGLLGQAASWAGLPASNEALIVTNTAVGPLYADLAGLPPIFVQTGGDDVLLDDSRQFAALAQEAGVAVTLEVSPGQQHVFQFLAGTTSVADAAIARGAEWLRARLRL